MLLHFELVSWLKKCLLYWMLKAVAVGKQTVRVWPLGRRSALAGKAR